VRLNAAQVISAKGCSSWPTPTSAEGTKIGSQANFGQVGLSNHPSIVGLPDREKLNKSGKSQELWATPTALMGSMYAEANADQRNSPSLATQAQNWATPHVPNGGQTTSGSKDKKTKKQIQLQHQVQNWPTPRNMTGGTCKNGAKHCDLNSKAGGKLNPSWVEQLMGLPVGWTQLPTEWIASAFSEMESSPPPAK
tara:strand:- start:20 stop:604 length:585 start_codon:yes stop_codon:yes gene_type:complete